VTQDPQELLEPVAVETVRAMPDSCDRRHELGCRDQAIMLCLLDTGCRASEFLSIDIGDVNFADGSVQLRHTKGRKACVVFLGAKSRREVLRYLRHRTDARPSSVLWTTRSGRRIGYAGLRDIMRRRARKAEVDVPTLHSFRRGFALYALRNGADNYSLQRLLGHSDLTVLRRYLKQTEADLQEAHRRAGLVDNLL
jgi:site-specific recombinase XerD